MEEGFDFTLRDYLAVFARRRFVLLGSVAGMIALALLYSSLRTPLYRATAQVLINQTNPGDQIFDYSAGDTNNSARNLANEASLVESYSVRTAVIESVPAARDASVAVTTSPSADIISISVVSADPASAAEVANAYAEAYKKERVKNAADAISYVSNVVQERLNQISQAESQQGISDEEKNSLDQQRQDLLQTRGSLELGGQLAAAGNVQVVQPATTPSDPVSPRVTRNVVLGTIAGVVLGMGLALIFDNLDRSIKSPAALEALTGGLANLAIVPSIRDWRNRDTTRLVSLEDPSAPTSEAYRTLRAALQFVAVDRSLSVIQLTSANPGEGKTTTSANLAVALSKAGRRVVLVDADLRKPRIHAFFDLPAEPGLTSVIIGQTELAQTCAVVQDGPGVLAVLPSGPLPPGPSELLGSQRAKAMFETLREVADIVIVDSPPVLPVSDSLVLADHVDATVLVVNAERARSDDVKRAVELLNSVDANVVGTVLNQISSSNRGYGYGYGYGYAQDEPKGRRRKRDTGDDRRRVRSLEAQMLAPQDPNDGGPVPSMPPPAVYQGPMASTSVWEEDDFSKLA